jgi:hypothetical protein
MKKFIIISFDEESATIEETYEDKETAEALCEKYREQYPEQNFTVDEIEVDEAKIDGDNEIANAIMAHTDAVDRLAGAFENIGDIMREFVTCACTVGALGDTPIHPTFNINKED